MSSGKGELGCLVVAALVVALTGSASAAEPPLEAEAFLPSPHVQSVDLSPDGSTLYARIDYADFDMGVRTFDGSIVVHGEK